MGTETWSWIVLIVAIVHTAATVVLAASTALPRPSEREMGRDIAIGLINIINVRSTPCFIILEFCFRWLALPQHDQIGVMSLLLFLCRTVLMALIGYRWLLRLGSIAGQDWDELPANAPLREWRIRLMIYYEWSFLASNHAAQAIGYMILFFCSCWRWSVL